MGISGRGLAILSARFGTARFGASRFGFCPEDVEGAGTDEPGEYVWKEHQPATTTWTLISQCEGNVCGWKPRASFTADPSSGYEDLEVDFTDTSTPTNDIDTWAWDFGDGSTSTDQNPTHTFTDPGVYTVTLTVTNSKGSDSTTGTVTVTALGSIIGIVSFSGVAAGETTVTLTPGGATTTSESETGYYEFLNVTPGPVSVTAVKTGGSGTNSGTVVSGEALDLPILVEPA